MVKKNIVLVSISGTQRINNKAVDLPLAYLRANNFNVTPYYFHGKLDLNDITDNLKNACSDIIAINITVYNCDYVINMINNSNFKQKIIIFGEYVAQFYREIFKKSSKIDFAILGDPEKPIEELCTKNFDYCNVSTYKSNIATVLEQNNKFPFFNQDFIMPAFDYLEQLPLRRRKRVEYVLQTKNSVCTGKCVFCRSRKGKIIFRDIEDIFEEIYIANKKYNVQKIFFIDDNILDCGEIAVERLSLLCDKIINSNLNLAFKCYLKANSCYNQELLEKMQMAGFTTIFVGLEAGSDEDLQFYNKLTTIEQNNNIMQAIKSAHIFPQIGFLMFNPHSTLEKLKKNYYFLLKHKIDDMFIWVSSVRIFKYTPLYEMAKQENLLFDQFDYINYSCRYKIIDKDVQEIYNFIMEKMYDRIFKLDYDFEFMYGFYMDVVQTHSSAKKFEPEILRIKEEQLECIKHFFKHLYVDNDLRYAEIHYDEFLNKFENDQIALDDIYEQLLSIYLE